MSQWIKVSDRLPEIGRPVLAANFKLNIYEACIFFYAERSGKPIFGASNGHFIATHWQPIIHLEDES